MNAIFYTSQKEVKFMRKTMKGAYKGFLIHPTIKHYFDGRQMDEQQTPFSMDVIHLYKKRGLLHTMEGVSWKRRHPLQSIQQTRFANPFDGQFICNRCENTSASQFVLYNCMKCRQVCAYCRMCIQMGRISTCTVLVTWRTPSCYTVQNRFIECKWQGNLSPLQEAAAEHVVKSYYEGASHLVHAVCGAGKTEILFPLIQAVLTNHQRLCIASPRTDVVLELFPRIQQAFPTASIEHLYGGHSNYEKFPSIMLTTTHQLLRFKEAFDVMIIDEVDAFPYSVDTLLQKAVNKAKKKSAPCYFITATPSPKLLQQYAKTPHYSYIPVRYHGQPVPVPTITALFRYKNQFHKGKFPKKLKRWIDQKIEEETPFLLFFPTIALMKKAHNLLKNEYPSILAVYSSDAQRKEKVLMLRKKEIQGLFTTTILERGITIERLDVGVVGAEHEVFTSSALQQIAGRVGRSARYPNGEVLLFAHGVSLAMDGAISQIKKHNAFLRRD
jgi:competence protein ComFA